MIIQAIKTLPRKLAAIKSWRRVVATWFDVLKLVALRFAGRGGGILSWVVVPIRLRGASQPLYLRCATSDFVTFLEIFIEGEYEAALAYAPAQVQGILDLGANVGLASRYFLEQWPAAFVVAVEPDGDNCGVLRSNLSAAKTSADGYIVVKAFVGDETRRAFLHKRGPGWANECTLADAPTIEGQDSTSVMTPQQLLGMCPRAIDLVKIDIEGTEKELFEGNLEWLGSCQLLVMEIHEPLDEGWVLKTLSDRLPSWAVALCERRHGGAHLVVLKRGTGTVNAVTHVER